MNAGFCRYSVIKFVSYRLTVPAMHLCHLTMCVVVVSSDAFVDEDE